MGGTRYVNSIIKAFETLNILLFEDAARKGISLADLSKRTGIPANTLHNILRTVIYCGYASQKADSSYTTGIKPDQLDIISGRDGHRDARFEKLKLIMEELQKAIGESVNIYILVNGSRIPLVMLEDNNIIKIDHRRMGIENIYKYSTGRILTAYADGFELKAILNRWGFPGGFWDGISDLETLDKARAEIRKAGHYEMVAPVGGTSVMAFAFPVFGRPEKITGALGSFIPIFRYDSAKRDAILREMGKTAALAGTILQEHKCENNLSKP